MRRRCALLLAGAALIAAAPSDEVLTAGVVPAPHSARERMAASLARAREALSVPPPPFAPSGAADSVSSWAGMLEGSKRWLPIQAWAERIYAEPAGAADSLGGGRVVEERVAINTTRDLSPGLGSVGLEPRPFEIAGAFALEQSTIGTDVGSRVALPLDPGERANAPRLIRIYVADSTLVGRLRATASARAGFPSVEWSALASRSPESVRTVVAEIYGPGDAARALARRVDVKALRKLLTP